MSLRVRGKNLSPEVWEKNSYMYPNQITHTPVQKSNGWPLKSQRFKINPSSTLLKDGSRKNAMNE